MQILTDPLRVRDVALAGRVARDSVTASGDWRTLADVDNLLQALWLRLNTPEGALARLGHPDYGSRLYLLIGELDTPEVRDRARLYVLRALRREPRVAEVVVVDVASAPRGSGHRLDVIVRVQPVAADTPLEFGFPLLLEPA